MKKIIIFIIILAVIIITCGFLFDWGNYDSALLISEQSATTVSDMPTIFSPLDNQTVTSPIHISGKVIGTWFFEGSFPIQLIDSNGNVIAVAIAQTSGDWATTSVIDFSATLIYPKATTTERALIMLKNDNPSGNPELDRKRFIPVTLK